MKADIVKYSVTGGGATEGGGGPSQNFNIFHEQI